MHLIPLPGSAPPDSELGLLQRGRGAGWLAATTSPDGVEHLLHCVTHDPRWDTQVEWRSDYLATVALRLEVDPAVIAEIARAADEDDYLPRDVLEKMSRRGSAGALDAIASLPTLDDGPPPTPTDLPLCPPMEAPVEDVVRKARPCCRLKFTNRFVATTDLYELDVLRSAALDPDLRWGRRHALRVLGLRGDPAPFEWAKNTLAANTRGFDRAAALGYMELLPADVALRSARAWLRHADGRGQAARKILATHAEPEDTVAIRHALDAIDDDYYAVCDLVEALGRLTSGGPYPELDVVYTLADYSYARARAATAIASTDPTFAERLAKECLWDCEDDVRALGAKHTPLTPAAAARLHELADDSHEEQSVRDAASVRLRDRDR